MNLLFGHPAGNPNSHHAALAHFEAERLEAFVVPWFPSRAALEGLAVFPPTRAMARRLRRRRFEPLSGAPKIQGRLGEWKRLAMRAAGFGDEKLSYEANDWLMETMERECRRRSGVSAVHSYEDCSLLQFQTAKRLGKACIYDMPIGYYAAWQETDARLTKEYSDWLPPGGVASQKFARPEQKKKEMELADMVLVPSTFVEATIKRFIDKTCARAAYGVDSEFWKPGVDRKTNDRLRFIYAGQLNIRKGTPLLIQAWQKADLKDAELILIGPWQLAEEKRQYLGGRIRHIGPLPSTDLLGYYQSSDVFVFPSAFEGFGLVLLEAMACGLPVIASDATAAPDIVDETSGRIIRFDDVNALVEQLRDFSTHRDGLPLMSQAAREKAIECSWHRYRQSISASVAQFS